MKKIVLLFILIGNFVLAHSQCDLPYKSVSEFDNDTTEFIMYNFLLRADCYENKTLGDVVNDLGISELQYIPGNYDDRSDFYNRLYIYIYSDEYLDRRIREELSGDIIDILLKTPLSKKTTDAFVASRGSYDWAPQVYERYKDLLVESVRVTPTFSSKYRPFYMKKYYNK